MAAPYPGETLRAAFLPWAQVVDRRDAGGLSKETPREQGRGKDGGAFPGEADNKRAESIAQPLLCLAHL